MELVSETVVLTMLHDTGHEGIEMTDGLEDMGPARLLNPPHENDGVGYEIGKMASYFNTSIREIREWVIRVADINDWHDEWNVVLVRDLEDVPWEEAMEEAAKPKLKLVKGGKE